MKCSEARHKRLLNFRKDHRRTHLEGCAQQAFCTLINELSIPDIVRLLECGLGEPDVYLYDPRSKTTTKPQPSALLWPIEFILTKFSKKHVLLRD